MPVVRGRHYAYTKKGRRAAAKARKGGTKKGMYRKTARRAYARRNRQRRRAVKKNGRYVGLRGMLKIVQSGWRGLGVRF